MFEQAVQFSESGETEQAFSLFTQAAKAGHIKAMGGYGAILFSS